MSDQVTKSKTFHKILQVVIGLSILIGGTIWMTILYRMGQYLGVFVRNFYEIVSRLACLL